MYAYLGKKGYPSEFPVRTKCILMFQKIHGVDVLLFVMYVHEYDQVCPSPNTRRVYISYLDSVKYFEPSCYRTLAYHSILVEYLRYVKKRGFLNAHIWCCPPSNGDNYVFNCRPPQQLTPKDCVLYNWYVKMLERAKSEKIVVKVKTLYEEYFINKGIDVLCEKVPDPMCLPYFEGDYIQGEIENIIKEINDEEVTKKKEKCIDSISPTEPKCKMGNKIGTRSNPGALVNQQRDKVMLRLGHALSPMKKNFIVVYLHDKEFPLTLERQQQLDRKLDFVKEKQIELNSKNNSLNLDDAKNDKAKSEKQLTNPHSHEQKKEPIFEKNVSHLLQVNPFHDINIIGNTNDRNPTMESNFFHSRQEFLNFCQNNNFQFDQLRRAKHSTMMILFHLHNPTAPKFLQNCGSCYREITHGIKYHCNECSNFVLCHDCYEPVISGLWAKDDSRFAHEVSHTFRRVNMEDDPDEKNYREKENCVQRHMEHLYHSAICKVSDKCLDQNCRRMKNLFEHVKECDVTYKKGCGKCAQLLSVLSMHARLCTIRGTCPIQFCNRIRLQNRRQQQGMDDRRRKVQNQLCRANVDKDLIDK